MLDIPSRRIEGALAQPTSIDDVLAYPAAVGGLPDGESRTFEIGGDATLNRWPWRRPRLLAGRGVRIRPTLRLAAEMKVPGRAWLEFDVEPAAHGAIVHQTAVFEPAGLSKLIYWNALHRRLRRA